MKRSFGLVEEKLREAEYFLTQLSRSGRHSQEAKYYFSAFVSASRSVTFAMQACLKDVNEFDAWYVSAQASLKSDLLAPHFKEFRNKTQKTGENPLGQVDYENLRKYFSAQREGTAPKHVLMFPSLIPGIHDAVKACEVYLSSIVRIVFDCYINFKTEVDPQWYFTKDVFERSGKTLQDALEELGFSSCWVDAMPPEADGWLVLRKQQQGCVINDLFHRYLGQIVHGPDEHDESIKV